MNYLAQVIRAIDFVEENLHETLSLEEVSKVAGVSHWHFLRMFKALTNETLKGYIRARRLAEARVELLTTEHSVLQIAVRAGFESQASFSRAFVRAFGTPPAQYRALGQGHVHVHKLQLSEEYLQHLHEGVIREPKLIERPALHMIGCTTTFYGSDSERNNLADKIPPLWDEFIPRAAEVAERVSTDEMFGVITQAEADGSLLEYTAAVIVSDPPRSLPAGMTHRVVPAARYAEFEHVGLTSDLDHTVDYVYSSWLLRSKHQHSYGPDLEIYDGRWKAESPDSLMTYAIPLAT